MNKETAPKAEELTAERAAVVEERGADMATAAEKAAAPSKAMALATSGKNYFIELNMGTEETPKWERIGGQRDSTLSQKADSIDATSKDGDGWKTTLQGLKEWSVELSSIIKTNDKTMTALYEAYLESQLVNVRFLYPDKSYVSGWASITEMSIEAPHDGAATYKGTLSGVGPLSDFQKGA